MQSMLIITRCCAIFLLILLVSGCISSQVQGNRHAGNGWYTVKPSDTLYSIAWRYGLDYKELANWNQISDDYIINLGQRLVMYNPGKKIVTEALVSSTSGNSSASLTTNQPLVKSTSESTTLETNPPARWRWPTEGKLLNTFSITQLDRRGIDIAGKLGQAVRATAAGKVVYSGNGLVGYGNLIIIKHNETYLSAYAYCKERLVSEGTFVKAGAIIARMGQHENKTARLHFEIRKDGKPVDPMKYLPNK
ncbi:MAG: lipoprotein NlpD [Oleiphilaceae bacterium]|jgi:lipoprotein NlpD